MSDAPETRAGVRQSEIGQDLINYTLDSDPDKADFQPQDSDEEV